MHTRKTLLMLALVEGTVLWLTVCVGVVLADHEGIAHVRELALVFGRAFVLAQVRRVRAGRILAQAFAEAPDSPAVQHPAVGGMDASGACRGPGIGRFECEREGH